MKNLHYTATLMALSTLLLLFIPDTAYTQHFETVTVDTLSDPDKVHVVIRKPDIEFNGFSYTTSGDASNTQILEFHFTGCGIANVVTYFDTVIDIPAKPPYTLKLYTIWDPGEPCPYPDMPTQTDSMTLFVTSTPTGIPEIHDLSERLHIYPVPSQGMITLKYDKSLIVSSLYVTDITGRQLAAFHPASTTLDISHLDTGTYLLHIHTTYGTLTRKIALE